jgi:hypothetical protein
MPPGGRLQIGTVAGFKSERVAGFNLECMAGFVGIRTSTSRTRSIERAGPRWNYKFKPPVLREVQDADDMMVSSMTISAGLL